MVSEIAEHDFDAAEADHGEEVLDVVLPAGDEAAEVVQPGEEPLDLPASPVAAQRATVLGGLLAVAAMRRNQLDVVALFQFGIQAVAVVGLVADQSRRELIEEAVGEHLFDELAFVG